MSNNTITATVATVENLKEAMALGGNILIEGLHGTGKTSMLRQAAEELGLSISYYNAPTIDPYTDLVGIPYVKQDENGDDYLDMVQQGTFKDSNVKFFDEINRAPHKTLNSLMELILEGSINGKVLDNHKICIAAINPSGGAYTTHDLEPALLDRFDFYFVVSEKPDRGFFRKKHGTFGDVLVSWWEEQFSTIGGDINEADYLSPRRLDTIGTFFMRSINESNKVMTENMFTSLFPVNSSYGTRALYKNLVKHHNKVNGNATKKTKYGYTQATVDTIGKTITRSTIRTTDDADLADLIENDSELAKKCEELMGDRVSMQQLVQKPLSFIAMVKQGIKFDTDLWVEKFDGYQNYITISVENDNDVTINKETNHSWANRHKSRKQVLVDNFYNLGNSSTDVKFNYLPEPDKSKWKKFMENCKEAANTIQNI